MNGPTHYRASEHMLNRAANVAPDTTLPVQQQSALLAAAQVHATLALAAAVVDQTSAHGHAAQAWVDAVR